ncbi:MAG: ACT domain-containing protein [Ornithinimicrobium sp.]
MSGEVRLSELLRFMSARVRQGSFVFVTVDEQPADVEVLASVVEAEGLSLVLSQQDADRLGLRYDFRAGWITLQVHSALEAVGLTAAVSAALTEQGISCNVIAGHHHDHLLVPLDRTEEALAVLRELSGSALGGGPVGDPTRGLRL